MWTIRQKGESQNGCYKKTKHAKFPKNKHFLSPDIHTHVCVKFSLISSHNKQVLQPHNDNYRCNCRKKENCPLDNKSLTPNIIYEAQITNNTNDDHKKYLGGAESSLKERYSNHKRDFKHKKYMNCTKLSKIYLEFEKSRYNTHS